MYNSSLIYGMIGLFCGLFAFMLAIYSCRKYRNRTPIYTSEYTYKSNTQK